MRAQAEPALPASAAPIARFAHRIGRALRAAPFSAAFAAAALISTLAIRADADDARVLRWMSTNVENLAHRPVLSLISSALYIDGGAVVGWAIALAAVLAIIERRYGTVCAVVAFASGHVLASLITQVAVGVSIAAGVLPYADSSVIDVGISYGFLSAAAVAVLMLRPPWAIVLALAVTSGLAGALAADPGLVSAGHLAAFCCGIGCALVLRARREKDPATSGT